MPPDKNDDFTNLPLAPVRLEICLPFGRLMADANLEEIDCLLQTNCKQNHPGKFARGGYYE